MRDLRFGRTTDLVGKLSFRTEPSFLLTILYTACHPERSATTSCPLQNDGRGVEGSRRCVLCHADLGSSLDRPFIRTRAFNCTTLALTRSAFFRCTMLPPGRPGRRSE